MIKRILSIIGMSTCLLCVGAEKQQYMTIEQLDGSKFSFLLDENPVVTYEGENLVVNGSATTSYAISNIKNYHFTESNETAVKGQVADMFCVVGLDEATLKVQNAKASEKVALINIKGVVISEASTDDEGSTTVKLPEQKGVYVLTVGTKAIKVIRK
ncbi:MAG: hypothetical protein K6E14_01005 [Paludibacteraceae bacterium]|jgi:hypothetical protein|nr:hypothetical protein [Paludibacteraceae bacterium]